MERISAVICTKNEAHNIAACIESVRSVAAQTGGEATHTLSAAESGVPAHTHESRIPNVAPGAGGIYGNGTTVTQWTNNAGGSGVQSSPNIAAAANAHENTPPWYALAFIMRTVQTAPSSAAIPAATESVAGLMSAADKTKIDATQGHYFSAQAIGTQALVAGVYTKVPLAGVNETDGNFASSSYTCPVSGRYQFNMGVTIQPVTVAGPVAAALYRGTAQVAVGPLIPVAAGGTGGSAFSITIHCAANDVMSLYAYAAGGGTVYGAAGPYYTYFTGQLMSTP